MESDTFSDESAMTTAAHSMGNEGEFHGDGLYAFVVDSVFHCSKNSLSRRVAILCFAVEMTQLFSLLVMPGEAMTHKGTVKVLSITGVTKDLYSGETHKQYILALTLGIAALLFTFIILFLTSAISFLKLQQTTHRVYFTLSRLLDLHGHVLVLPMYFVTKKVAIHLSQEDGVWYQAMEFFGRISVFSFFIIDISRALFVFRFFYSSGDFFTKTNGRTEACISVLKFLSVVTLTLLADAPSLRYLLLFFMCALIARYHYNRLSFYQPVVNIGYLWVLISGMCVSLCAFVHYSLSGKRFSDPPLFFGVVITSFLIGSSSIYLVKRKRRLMLEKLEEVIAWKSYEADENAAFGTSHDEKKHHVIRMENNASFFDRWIDLRIGIQTSVVETFEKDPSHSPEILESDQKNERRGSSIDRKVGRLTDQVMNMFPTSSEIRVFMASVLLDMVVSKDWNRDLTNRKIWSSKSKLLLNEVKRMKQSPDSKVVAYVLHRWRLEVEGIGEEMKRELKAANRKKEAVLELSVSFWRTILKRSWDKEMILSLVHMIEEEARQAERRYINLIQTHSRNMTALRAYADYLDVIKGDKEQAEEYLTAARRIEEGMSMAKREMSHAEEELSVHSHMSGRFSRQSSKKRFSTVPNKNIGPRKQSGEIVNEKDDSENDNVSSVDVDSLEFDIVIDDDDDKEMKIYDDSSSSASSAMAKMARMEMESRESKGSKRMRRFLTGLIIFSILFLVTGYFVSQGALMKFATFNKNLEKCGLLFASIAQSVHYLLEEHTDEHEMSLSELGERMFDLQRQIVNDITDDTLEDVWFSDNDVTLQKLTQKLTGEMVESESQSTLWRSISELTSTIHLLKDEDSMILGINATDSHSTDPRYFFIVRNGLGSLFTKFNEMMDVYQDVQEESNAVIEELSIVGALGVIYIIGVGVCMVLVISGVSKEREGESFAFSAIPSKAVRDLFESTKNEYKRVSKAPGIRRGIVRARAAEAAQRWSPIKLMVLAIIVFCAFVFIGIMAHFVIIVFSNMSVVHDAAEINFSGKVYAYSFACTSYGSHLTSNYTFEERDRIRDEGRKVVSNAKWAFRSIRYGDSQYNLPGIDPSRPDLMDILLGEGCRDDDTDDLVCMGLEKLFDLSMRNFDSLYDSYPDEGEISSVELNHLRDAFSKIGHLYHHHFIPLIEEFLSEVTNARLPMVQNSQEISLLTLLISVPLVILLFILLPILRLKSLQRERQTVNWLMLQVPMNIILSEEVLRQYVFDDGAAIAKEALAREELDTKKMLRGTVDGFLEIAEGGLIADVNSSAEEIFGLNLEKMIGEHVTDFFSPNHKKLIESYVRHAFDGRRRTLEDEDIVKEGAHKKRRGSEVVRLKKSFIAYRKDGSPFHTITNVAILEGKKMIMFVRDVSEEKKFEGLLRTEKEKSEDLLLNILPKSIAGRLQEGGRNQIIADLYPRVTVLFLDLVGFASWSRSLSPHELVSCLNDIFRSLDSVVQKNGMEKMKTIGDAYFAIAGLPDAKHDHAQIALECAIQFLEAIERFNKTSEMSLECRIGLHSGEVVAGVIGSSKMTFDAWGTTVNVASRMESTGIPGRIHLSRNTYKLLHDQYKFTSRGIVELKGIGEMQTYLFVSRLEEELEDDEVSTVE